MFYFLTSSAKPIKVDVCSTSVRAGDPVFQSKLSLKLKTKIGRESFAQQQVFLNKATNAAFNSLTKIDQRNRFRLSIDYQLTNDESINFADGSSSSGLAYAVAVYHSICTNTLQKQLTIENPIFCSGQMNNDGSVTEVGFIENKVTGLLNHVQKTDITGYILCLPRANEKEISEKLNHQIIQSGGVIYFGDTIEEVLFKIYGADFDGDSLGRWLPFKGLESFEYEDSLRFFGRTQDIQRLYDDINYNNGILIVSGSSGSGKSSLIKAGLIPLLMKQDLSFFWAAVTPSTLSMSIIDTFLNSLTTHIVTSESDFRKISAGLKADSDEAYASLSKSLTGKTFLFYIDQFEEFFTKNTEDKYIQDIAVLQKISSQVPQVKIVFAIRNEYISVLLDTGIISSPVISNVSENLSSQSWHEIVNEQAAFSNITFEKEPVDLAQVIVDDAIKTPSALPVVSYILAQLYECVVTEHNSKVCLRYEDYEHLGGLKGVIAKRAEDAIQQANVSEKDIHLFFSMFIGINYEGICHAREVSLDENNISVRLIHHLTAHSILKHNSLNDSYKLAHESLLLSWDRLKQWVKTQKDFLVWLNRIDFDFKSFGNNKQKSHLIQNQELLNEGMAFIENGTLINKSIVSYVNVSKKAKIKKRRNFFIKFVVLPIALIGLFWFDKESTRDEYYANYGLKYGVPFGVGELNSEQKKFKQFRYRLTYQGGQIAKFLGYGNKLLEMAHENSLGYTFTTDYNNFKESALWVYEYNQNDKVENINVFNQAGILLERQNIIFNTKGASVYFVNKDNNYIASSSASDEVDGNPYKSSSVVRKDIVFDQYGFHKVEQYKRNGFGDPTSDSLGVNERHFEYNLTGLIKQETAIAYTKKLTKVKSKISHKYNDLGLRTISDYTSSLNAKGVKDKSFSYKQYLYDQYGNLIEEKYLQQDKQPGNNSAGVYKRVFSINSDGFVDRIIEVDKEGKPNSEYGILGYKVLYDIFGYPSNISYIDENYKDSTHPDGYSSISYNYNESGYLKRELYFDLKRKPAQVIGSLYTGTLYSSQYDSLVKKREYLNDKGQVIRIDGEFSYDLHIIDNDNHTEKFSSFDYKGELVINPFTGCAILEFEKSSKGLILNRKCYDTKGRLKDGYKFPATTRLKYNEERFLLERKFFDSSNQLVDHPTLKYAIFRSSYDTFGNQILLLQLDSNNRPALDVSNNIAGWKAEYDELGYYRKFIFIDRFSNPTIHPVYKNAGLIYEFDDNGNQTLSLNLGLNEEVIIHPSEMVAGWRAKYDDKGRRLLFEFLGVDQNPLLPDDKPFAGLQYGYDEFGNVNKTLYLDEYGQPMLHRGSKTAGSLTKYDLDGNVIEYIFLGKDLKPMIDPKSQVAGFVAEYHQKNNPSLWYYLGTDLLPMINPEFGTAGFSASYDNNGNQLHFYHLNVDGELMIAPDTGEAGWSNIYDKNKNLTSRYYFDIDLNPVEITPGYASWEKELDKKGKVLKIKYFDINGTLIGTN